MYPREPTWDLERTGERDFWAGRGCPVYGVCKKLALPPGGRSEVSARLASMRARSFVFVKRRRVGADGLPHPGPGGVPLLWGAPCSGPSALHRRNVTVPSGGVAPVVGGAEVPEIPGSALGPGLHVVHGGAEGMPPPHPEEYGASLAVAEVADAPRWTDDREEASALCGRWFSVGAVGAGCHRPAGQRVRCVRRRTMIHVAKATRVNEYQR